MRWGHIKMLFILSFLTLNIYLAAQIMEKQQEADLGILTNQEATIEERLKAENITISEKNIEEAEEETYISLSSKSFANEEIVELAEPEGENVSIVNGTFLISRFEEPIPIPDQPNEDMLKQLLRNRVVAIDEYTFWGWNKDLNILVFFQQKGGRPVYYNQNGLLLIYLNDRQEMIFSTQTMLGEEKEQGGMKPLIQPIQAIEVLYNRNDLQPNEEVTNVSVGFYSRLIAEDGKQVLAPTWKVTINDERNYFVNAIEGFTFPIDDRKFLQTVIEETMKQAEMLDDENKWKQIFLTLLSNKIEKDN